MRKTIQSIIYKRFILTLTGLVLVISLIMFFQVSGLMGQFLLEDNSSAVEFLAGDLENFYSKNLHSVDTLADLIMEPAFDRDRAEILLRHFLELQYFFNGAAIYKSDGTLLQKVSPYTPLTRENNFNDKWDKSFVMTANEVIASGKGKLTPFLKNESGLNYQVYLTPLKEQTGRPLRGQADRYRRGPGGDGTGRNFGVLGISILYDPAHASSFLQGLKLNQDNFLLLTDHLGNVLIQDGLQSPDDSDLLTPVLQDMASSLKVQHSNQLIYQTLNLEKDSQFTLFAGAIPSLHLSFNLGVNHKSATEKIASLIRSLYVVLALALLASFVISAWVTRKISAPITALSDGLQRLDAGDFSDPVNYDGDDDFGDICRKVNELSRKIEKARYLNHLWSEDP